MDTSEIESYMKKSQNDMNNNATRNKLLEMKENLPVMTPLNAHRIIYALSRGRTVVSEVSFLSFVHHLIFAVIF